MSQQSKNFFLVHSGFRTYDLWIKKKFYVLRVNVINYLLFFHHRDKVNNNFHNDFQALSTLIYFLSLSSSPREYSLWIKVFRSLNIRAEFAEAPNWYGPNNIITFNDNFNKQFSSCDGFLAVGYNILYLTVHKS